MNRKEKLIKEVVLQQKNRGMKRGREGRGRGRERGKGEGWGGRLAEKLWGLRGIPLNSIINA